MLPCGWGEAMPARDGMRCVRERACGSAAQRRRRHGGARWSCMAWHALRELCVGSGRRLVEDPRKLPERHVRTARRCRYVVVKLVAERNLHVVFNKRTS